MLGGAECRSTLWESSGGDCAVCSAKGLSTAKIHAGVLALGENKMLLKGKQSKHLSHWESGKSIPLAFAPVEGCCHNTSLWQHSSPKITEGACLPRAPTAPPTAAFVESKMGEKGSVVPARPSRCTSTIRLWKEGILFGPCCSLSRGALGKLASAAASLPRRARGRIWLVFLTGKFVRTQTQRLTAVP